MESWFLRRRMVEGIPLEISHILVEMRMRLVRVSISNLLGMREALLD